MVPCRTNTDSPSSGRSSDGGGTGHCGVFRHDTLARAAGQRPLRQGGDDIPVSVRARREHFPDPRDQVGLRPLRLFRPRRVQCPRDHLTGLVLGQPAPGLDRVGDRVRPLHRPRPPRRSPAPRGPWPGHPLRADEGVGLHIRPLDVAPDIALTDRIARFLRLPAFHEQRRIELRLIRAAARDPAGEPLHPRELGRVRRAPGLLRESHDIARAVRVTVSLASYRENACASSAVSASRVAR